MSLAGPKTVLSQHSDFKNVALPYVYQMYKAMINKGRLQDLP
jgi:hypothetical protein